MHPNAFLKTFWRLSLRNQIFVAMSFDPKYDDRFKKVIKPAIESVTADGALCHAYRVDLSKTGDSLLTDIVDGIAHSQMVLADVSTVGNDKISGKAFRNGNVMYEVGIALACRHPSEVLLVRDDKEEKFLFDVSTILHEYIDFTEEETARKRLQELLLERLTTRNKLHDTRVQIALAALSLEEIKLLRKLAAVPVGKGYVVLDTEGFDLHHRLTVPRLLDKGLIVTSGEIRGGKGAAIDLTPLGKIVATEGIDSLTQYDLDRPDSDKLENVS